MKFKSSLKFEDTRKMAQQNTADCKGPHQRNGCLATEQILGSWSLGRSSVKDQL